MMANNQNIKIRPCKVAVAMLNPSQMPKGLGFNDLRIKLKKKKSAQRKTRRPSFKHNNAPQHPFEHNESINEYSADEKTQIREQFFNNEMEQRTYEVENENPHNITYVSSGFPDESSAYPAEMNSSLNYAEEENTTPPKQASQNNYPGIAQDCSYQEEDNYITSVDGESSFQDASLDKDSYDGDLTKEEENRLLADADAASLFSEVVNEDELLKDDDLREELEARKMNSKENEADQQASVSNHQSLVVKTPVNNEEDMFDTVSLAATHCDFYDELEPGTKKQLPNSLALSTEEKVSNWKQRTEVGCHENFQASKSFQMKSSSFKIPKKEGVRQGSNGFAKPAPPSRINNANSKVHKKRDMIASNNIRRNMPRKPCFSFRKYGYCTRDVCNFYHDASEERLDPKNELREDRKKLLLNKESNDTKAANQKQTENRIDQLLHEDLPAIEDYKNMRRKNVEKPDQPSIDAMNTSQRESNHQGNNIQNFSPVSQQQDRLQNNDFQKKRSEEIGPNTFDFNVSGGSQFPPPPPPGPPQAPPRFQISNKQRFLQRNQHPQAAMLIQNNFNAQVRGPSPHNNFNQQDWLKNYNDVKRQSQFPVHGGHDDSNQQNLFPPHQQHRNNHTIEQNADFINRKCLPKNPNNEQMRTKFSPPMKQRRSSKTSYDLIGKSFEELDEIFSSDDNMNSEQAYKIILAMREVTNTNGHSEILKRTIEQTLMNIHLNIQDNWNQEYLEIARELLSIKQSRNYVKRQDLYILAECESIASCYKNTINILHDMRARKFNIEGLERNGEDFVQLFYNSIETHGMILQFWKEFREAALRSYKVVDKLLSNVSFEALEKTLQEEDFRRLFKYFLEKKDFEQISNTAKTCFLRLIVNLLPNLISPPELLFDFLLRFTTSIQYVPKKIVEVVLSLSCSIPDVLKPYNLLKNLLQIVTHDVWREFSKQWNDLLIYLCRRGEDSASIQIVEQYYGVMQLSKVVPSIECALMMLTGFVKTCYFEVFETHYQGFLKLKVFPSGFHYPDNFAQEVSDNIEKYTRDDKNCLHYMVSILLSSNYPPPEPCINEVLNMLVSKRRFSDVHKLVTKCFSCSIILSQQELRRVIYALEEWMQNVNASVEIYRMMREKYPRPEHQCVCGGNVKPQSITSRISSSGELASPKSSTSSHEGDIELCLQQPALKPTNERGEVYKISAELGGAANDHKNFANVFDKAWENKLMNHEKIVAGLFLGITGSDSPSTFFETFVVQLFSRHESDSHVMDKTLGRVAVRLMKYLYDRQQYADVVSTLYVLHTYMITYANCCEPFGTMIESSENLTTLELAQMCCHCCFNNEKVELVFSVFNHFKEVISSQQIDHLVSYILQNSLHKKPSQALHLLLKYHEKIENVIVDDFLNSIVLNLEREVKIEDIFEAELFFRSNHCYVMYKESLKTFVNVYGKRLRIDDARRLYRQGVLHNFYKETFREPYYHVEIPTRSRSTEIYLAIEWHISQLCSHPHFGIEGEEFGKNPLHLIVVPCEDPVDAEQFNANVIRTMKKIAHSITQEFSPPLQMITSQKQKYTIAPDSIREWFEYSKKNPGNTIRGNVRKRKRQIDNKDDKLLMTICPTPVSDFPANSNSISNNDETETLAVNTRGLDKRVLKHSW